jgi:hypothetical protein
MNKQGLNVKLDTEYFRRRASEERSAAASSTHATARASHQELAKRYEDAVSALDGSGLSRRPITG